MLAAHHAAARARLDAHTLLAGKVDDVVRLTPGDEPVMENFVAIGTTLYGVRGERLTGEQSPDGDYGIGVAATVVAVDAAGAYLLMDAVSEQLIGHRLTVPGRALTSFEREELGEPQWDPRARMVYIEAVFEATTSRAA